MKFQSKFIYFHSRKCIWKCRLGNGGHLVSASMCTPLPPININGGASTLLTRWRHSKWLKRSYEISHMSTNMTRSLYRLMNSCANGAYGSRTLFNGQRRQFHIQLSLSSWEYTSLVWHKGADVRLSLFTRMGNKFVYICYMYVCWVHERKRTFAPWCFTNSTRCLYILHYHDNQY